MKIQQFRNSIIDFNISPMSKLLLFVLCEYYNTNTGDLYPSLRTLAKDMSCAINTVQRAIKELESKKIIKISKKRKSYERNFSNYYILEGVVPVSDTPVNIPTDIPMNIPTDIPTVDTELVKLDKLVYSKTKKFVVPALEEIRNYIKDRKWSVDPDRFFSHYESNGWMVGKNKMKDWKSAVKTWHYRENPKPAQNKKKALVLGG